LFLNYANDSHSKMVLGICRRMLRDTHAADDAFQASFFVLARRAPSISKRASVGGWLCKVAYRVALQAKAQTSKQAHREIPLQEVSTELGPGANAEQRELHLLIDEEVNRLPEKYRLPLVLCYFEGKSNGETARELGCPVGTLQSRLTRARERLRTRLTRRGVVPSAGLLAGILSESVASTCVPTPLVTSTAAIAARLAAGQALGTASVRVAALTEGVLRAMWITKVRIIAVVLAVSLLGTGAGLLTHRAWGEKPSAIEKGDSSPRQAGGASKSNVAQSAAGESMTRIMGVVVDEAGRPVAGTRVNVTWLRKNPEDTTTAADGSFSLQIGFPIRSSETVHAFAESGARQGLARFEESFSPASLPVRVVLKPARNLTVHVRDVKGSPVEGAAVELPFLLSPFSQALTDARGIAWFRLPADADVVHILALNHVLALKSGFGFDVFENYRSWPPFGTQETLPEKVFLTLDGARRVAIKAIDSAGSPVAGVSFAPVEPAHFHPPAVPSILRRDDFRRQGAGARTPEGPRPGVHREAPRRLRPGADLH
jgi:RNA polymerase sigma factor (sigma-70 family)